MWCGTCIAVQHASENSRAMSWMALEVDVSPNARTKLLDWSLDTIADTKRVYLLSVTII
eukprot:m.1640638 g.1640638  ORF g.1640638 m.1640638 type:complete len:59 (+) comp43196_c0_seq1:272-448(+)